MSREEEEKETNTELRLHNFYRKKSTKWSNSEVAKASCINQLEI